MSALNYEFLVQPTRMEGKNSYCVVKCVIKCVMNEQYNRWSLSFCRAIKMRELAWKSPPTNACMVAW